MATISTANLMVCPPEIVTSSRLDDRAHNAEMGTTLPPKSTRTLHKSRACAAQTSPRGFRAIVEARMILLGMSLTIGNRSWQT